MAQTGYTAIQLYYSTTVSATPGASDLAAGELAINTADEKLYFKNSSGSVKLIAASLMVGTNGGTGVNNGSRTISYAGNVAFTGAFNPTFAIPSSSTYTFPTGDSTLVATTGTVATATAANGLKTATTTVSISGATAPSAGQTLVASSSTNATWATIGVSLNAVTAAGGSSTIANGNNPITWNWAQTTASQTAFSISETSAATGGSGAQNLVQISTVAASTANPFRVKARGSDVILVGSNGDLTTTGVVSSFGGSTSATLAGGAVVISGNSLSSYVNTTTSIRSGPSYAAEFGSVDNVTSNTGQVTVFTGSIASGTNSTGGLILKSGTTSGSGASGDVSISTGASTSGNSGAISIASGTSNGSGTCGNVTISVGTSTSTSAGTCGSVAISGGSVSVNGGARGAGDVSITGGSASGTGQTGNGGDVTITAGSSQGATGGDITLTPGTGVTAGRINFVSSSTANGSVATVLGSVGPAGASTTVQTWLTVKVGGTVRYIPCF